MWGHVSSQVGHIAYQLMRLCERNTMGPSPALYLYSIKSKRQKTNVTSYDLEWPEGEVIGSKLHMGHREGPNVWISWDKWHVSMSTFGKNGIWTFPHCPIMVRFQNWPNLRSPKSKFREIHFVGTDTLINSRKFHIGASKNCSHSEILNIF